MILFHLDMKGIAVSRGSACQSGSNRLSHVLSEILSNENLQKPSLRISLSHFNTKEDLNLEFSISAATREPRGQEVDGKDYYFLDSQDFINKINNNEFLEETGVIKSLKYNDEFLRPYMVSNCNYDIMMGSANTCTPFRYEINYRNYYLLTEGSAQIKLAPPHSIRYLYPNYDYENFEFRSPVDPWSPQPKYIADFDKMKCLEFTLTPGKTLYIPAYWWYSIKFNKNILSCSILINSAKLSISMMPIRNLPLLKSMLKTLNLSKS